MIQQEVNMTARSKVFDISRHVPQVADHSSK
uniref:Uncharacterized protein n=1 Tax=Romanomermis culicivorax TaxID=13658 RepID=A0A915HPH2_ROMCU